MLVTVENTGAVESFDISRLVMPLTLLSFINVLYCTTFVRPVPIKVKAVLLILLLFVVSCLALGPL